MNLQKIVRPVVIAALFLIPIFPLIVANSYFFPFITGKAFYFRILVEIAFLGWVILAFLDAKYRPRLNAITIATTLFVVVTFVADLLGVNPVRSIWSNFERMEGWITIVHLWAFYIAATGVFGSGEEGRRWWHRWFNMSLIFAFFVACYGMWQLFGWAAIHQGSSRIDASLGNSAYMAVYMLLSAGIAAYLFFVAYAKKIANYSALVWIYPILTILFSFELIETATRGTILGLGMGVMAALILYGVFVNGVTKTKMWTLVSFVVLNIIALALSFKVGFGSFTRGSIYSALLFTGIVSVVYFIVFAVYVFKTGHSFHHVAARRARYWILGIFALVFIVSGLFVGLHNSAFVQHNEVLSRMASISLQDSSGQARQYIWPMALKGALDRPIFGWGEENFNYIFNAYYNPHMYNQEQWFDRAHSVFLDWLTASGAVGLIAYLALYVLFLVLVWKSTLTLAEKSVLTGLLGGYAIHNLFVFDNLASYVLFFSVLGFAASLKEGVVPHWLGGKKEVRADAVEYIVAPIAIIVFVAALYFVNVRVIQANTRLIGALQACGSTPDAAIPLFESALAVHSYAANQEIREQILSCTSNVIQAVSSGQANVSMQVEQSLFGLSTQAIADQTAATPKDARIFTLGGSFLNGVGQTAQALPLLEKAHALSPMKQSIDFQLANAYVSSGRNDDALALLKQAYEEDPTYDQARLSYAVALIVVGKEDEAHTLFNNDPSIFETQQMAQVYASIKKYPQAIAILKQLLSSDAHNLQLESTLAQVQYQAGMISQAIATLKAIETDHPEYKANIDATIQQIQKGK